MKIVIITLVALVAGFFGGVYTSAALTGNLVPTRDRLGACAAMNTDTGEIVGTWPLQGRCAIRDWRLRHPFGG